MRRALPLFAILFAACATARTQSLTRRIDAIRHRPQLAGAIWGIDVIDDSGRTIYARNETTLLIPASNRKLFAAATVASCEGLDRRIPTELWRNGDDLVIRGGGDPSLGGRWAFDRDAVFAPFVDALHQRGIADVRDVIADVSLFDRVTIPSTWKVGNLGSDYAVPTDALAYNENVVGVVADHCAAPVVVTDPSFVPANANVACGRGEPTVRSDVANAIAIIGPMPEHFQTLAGIDDPALYAAQALRDALQHAGIRVTGKTTVNSIPQNWQERIAMIDSPPLWQLLSVVLKPSQNLYAEMLFKGLSAGAEPASYEASEDIERRFLTSEAGVPASDFRFVDGCGLSPDDLVTPRAIVTILRWMNEPARRAIWWMMLARPGDDGTLRRRLLPFADRMRGKTGSISGVNALSGIIRMPNGTHRYFSIIINHNAGDSSDALKAIDAIVGEIAK
ncbi:MAG TPA: D-alanyl-D-alanine carboxypeptidase/D-alanyl-D-alanine-endopeptidase [Thermoanaerobaculia bacterium]|nr:D-alanyl-D-alanine carboxypeptidase/D-alanyl-D-alanine-endopeptidase [Thermoanaerobaculia bacterium]